MFALEPGLLGANLRALGESLPDVAAVLVVSPHWQTPGVRVGSSPAPETPHNFAGFPAPLYTLQYPAPGAPEWAHEAAKLLAQAEFGAALEERHGLDHGAWVRCGIYSPTPARLRSRSRCRMMSTRLRLAARAAG